MRLHCAPKTTCPISPLSEPTDCPLLTDTTSNSHAAGTSSPIRVGTGLGRCRRPSATPAAHHRLPKPVQQHLTALTAPDQQIPRSFATRQPKQHPIQHGRHCTPHAKAPPNDLQHSAPQTQSECGQTVVHRVGGAILLVLGVVIVASLILHLASTVQLGAIRVTELLRSRRVCNGRWDRLCCGGRCTRHAVRARAPVLCVDTCLLYTSPSPRDRTRSRMPSSA
eukprot:TRINITY_DN131_c0_g1_i10.p1 TRINITY_DN131_c0_g1~~TRINITY_DN131_c0_g1_i10.p1  ORF type:complete len:223 (-),score=13.73 TRINITY_DN131_c0_g1_i10:70-738(-)